MRNINPLEANEEQREVDALMGTATKHYMRRKVWLPTVARRKEQVGRPVNYFTLTTADLLDVKLLERAGLIERNERGYPGVGFCERNHKIYADIIRKLRWCQWDYKGTFEEMALKHPHFESDFGFDVINLDFTWVPFPGQRSPLRGTWGAIQRMLEVQWGRGMSFDLFLTFRGTRKGTNDEAIERVARLLCQNLESGRGVEEFRSRIGHVDPMRLLGDDYVTFLCMGLPKLLVGDALDRGFDVSRADAYWYPRGKEAKAYYIVKFVLGLEVPAVRRRTFAVPPQVVAGYDAAVSQVFSNAVVDVAEVVEADPLLRSRLEEELKELKCLG